MNDDEQSDQEVGGAIDLMRQQRQQEQQQQQQQQHPAKAQARPRKVVPLWSNLDLPPQPFSIVAGAAHALRSEPSPVPENLSLAPAKRRHSYDKEEHRLPSETVTLSVYEAFAALSLVTVLTKDNDVKRLVAAELAELEAAAGFFGGAVVDPAAAAPRHMALTVLIPKTSVCQDRTFLLDAMALLAHAGEAPRRAAREVRMAVLTNEQAVYYAEKTDSRALNARHTEHAELVFAYVAEDGGRQALRAPLGYGGSAKAAFKVLVATIVQLFKEADLPLLPSLSLSVGSAADSLDGAHVKSHLAVNGEFWKRVCKVEEAPKLDFQLRFGEGPEEQTYVKLAPKSVNLDDPEVYFGMLMFREGMDKKKAEYVLGAMMEERRGKPPHAPIGLRPPARSWEREAEPHILSMSAETVSLRGDLCCYTTCGVPGKMMAPYDNASMPCLHYALTAYTDSYAGHTFVLPCTQDQIDEDHDLHCRAQWQAAKQGVLSKYPYLCGAEDMQEDMVVDEEGGVAVNGKKLKGVASIEEEALAAMIGIPLGSAFRLGEVNEVVSRSKQELKVVRAFLTASILRLGRNASIADALQKCVEIETDRAALAAEAGRLRDELASARAAAPPPAASVEIAPCSKAVADMLLGAMKMETKAGMVVAPPMTTGKIIGIGRVLYTAKGTPPSPKSQHDAAIQEHAGACKGMNAVGVAAYLAEKMHHAPLYAVVVLESGEQVEFFKTSTNGNGQITKVSGMEMMHAYKSPEDNPLFIRYDVKALKIHAFIW